MEHARGAAELMGERHGVIHLRAQLPRYVRGFRGAVRVRERMLSATTLADVEAIFRDMEERLEHGGPAQDEPAQDLQIPSQNVRRFRL